MGSSRLTSFSFPSSERLKGSKCFDRVFREGYSLQSSHFVVLFVRNDLNSNRLGIMIRRKFGKAHDRNRLRRWIRETYRLTKPCIAKGFDIVVLPRKALSDVFAKVSFHQVFEELSELYKRIGA